MAADGLILKQVGQSEIYEVIDSTGAQVAYGSILICLEQLGLVPPSGEAPALETPAPRS